MLRNPVVAVFYLMAFAGLLATPWRAAAQFTGTPQVPGTPLQAGNMPQRDTTKRAATTNWHDEQVIISARRAFSAAATFLPDSSIHTFDRRPFSQPWLRDLGNLGTSARPLLFAPEGYGETGPRLGFHTLDAYRLAADSLDYFRTSRPYTSFQYGLGSRLEQLAQILHTQNIRPNWNFSLRYTKLTSPGFYRIQRTNQDHGAINTWYVSPRQHYELHAALVYNRGQQDENGGIVSDSFLSNPRYGDHRTIPVAFQNDFYSTQRSSVTNDFRDYHLLLQHRYTLGRGDTTWSPDSTKFTYRLLPRFAISHRLSLGDERLRFQNQLADSTQWSSFFTEGLQRNDSVQQTQSQRWLENVFTLNGYAGKRRNLEAWAGAGNRIDAFRTFYINGTDAVTIVSNFMAGGIRKAQDSGTLWAYGADARLIVTGAAAGNFFVDASASRSFKNVGNVRIRFRQDLRQAAYNFSLLHNQFYEEQHDLQNESITLLEGAVTLTGIGLHLGVRNWLAANYTYLSAPGGVPTNGKLDVVQSAAFNLSQVWLRKTFRYGVGVLDNEVAYQQKTGGAPVNVPAVMGRHQLSAEGFLFRRALQAATGLEVRYHTAYKAAGYAPFYNRFYYQDAVTVRNKPELTAFFNFRVKRFRAYFALDQLQQLWWANNTAAPGYATQNFMIRFGFEWVMVN